MKVGVFGDTHDHLPNIRLAVERFNEQEVELVLFAGDFVSTIAVPPLRKLKAPIVACFGDNEGNKIGLHAGFKMVGTLGEPPLQFTADDGTRFVLVHMKRQLRAAGDNYDIAIVGHTHKPKVETDELGRMLVNPGETSGWSFGRPTIAILDTATREATILDLIPPSAS